ncbi:hypothetical protein Taro_014737 [Colocasia esculenta]|uniref:AAA+ ATPase domain-containing protein n=1 Tax=Colocasia esculenta TaxID=4460 RepID=A0A843UJZ7_COLES|nr:hypothetical protein [Colocasia esculenta]
MDLMSRSSTLLDWKSIGSILATFMFLRTALRDFLPPELQQFISRLFSRLVAAVNPRVSILIDEYDPSSYTNELFDAAHAYLGDKCRLVSSSSSSSPAGSTVTTSSTRLSHQNACVLRLSKPKNSRYLSFSMDANQRLDDHFPDRGAPGAIPIRWSFHTVQRSGNPRGGNGYYPRVHNDEHRYYELSFHRRHQVRVQDEYIPFVMEEAARIRFKNRERRLYTNRSAAEDGGCGRHWSSVPFNHPSTFDTLAIDPALKDEIQADLRKFVSRRDYYSRVGRAWKRGYLLHGPPGTGKTSLIAAIANFLEFDIYDLELTAVTSNSQLRKLLVSTSSKSVVVVEDIDCTLDLSDRKKRSFTDSEDPTADPGTAPGESIKSADKEDRKRMGCYSTVSLSGVLNFIDGLWSSCVGERLMIFTTNHVEKLDPALLRPGRMDRHIHLSYCGAPAFKILAKNYLDVVDGHPLMLDAETLLQEVKVTPAEVAEVFMGCEDDADKGMQRMVEEMRQRRRALASQQVEDQHAGGGPHMNGTVVNGKVLENGVSSDEELAW